MYSPHLTTREKADFALCVSASAFCFFWGIRGKSISDYFDVPSFVEKTLRGLQAKNVGSDLVSATTTATTAASGERENTNSRLSSSVNVALIILSKYASENNKSTPNIGAFLLWRTYFISVAESSSSSCASLLYTPQVILGLFPVYFESAIDRFFTIIQRMSSNRSAIRNYQLQLADDFESSSSDDDENESRGATAGSGVKKKKQKNSSSGSKNKNSKSSTVVADNRVNLQNSLKRDLVRLSSQLMKLGVFAFLGYRTFSFLVLETPKNVVEAHIKAKSRSDGVGGESFVFDHFLLNLLKAVPTDGSEEGGEKLSSFVLWTAVAPRAFPLVTTTVIACAGIFARKCWVNFFSSSS